MRMFMSQDPVELSVWMRWPIALGASVLCTVLFCRVLRPLKRLHETPTGCNIASALETVFYSSGQVYSIFKQWFFSLFLVQAMVSHYPIYHYGSDANRDLWSNLLLINIQLTHYRNNIEELHVLCHRNFLFSSLCQSFLLCLLRRIWCCQKW